MSPYPIVHIELSAKDRQEAQEFYAELFGWKFTNHKDMQYSTFKPGGEVAGGISDANEDNPTGMIIFYIQSDEITDTLARIEAAGGKIAMPETDFPGVGKLAYFKDPTGNVIGLISRNAARRLNGITDLE